MLTKYIMRQALKGLSPGPKIRAVKVQISIEEGKSPKIFF